MTPLFPQETLIGLIERVTCHNPKTGFCVLKVKVKGHKDLVSVVGGCVVVAAGEWIEAGGCWVQDRQYGQQFKALSLRVMPPTTLEGIEKYLGSGMIKGIGPVYAAKLVKTFGENVFTVIEEDPEQLRFIPGIGTFRAEKIIAGWAAQKAIRTIMLFLHSHGISTARAVKIYKTYGDCAIDRIRENPYRLAQDIHGIGFLSADKIAMSLGIEKTSILRARAGISYALSKAMDEGNCGLPTPTLMTSCQGLLDIEEALILQALSMELQVGSVIKDTVKAVECIFLSGLYKAEKGIAERLQELSHHSLPWPEIDADKAIQWVEQNHGLTLSSSQKEALSQALLAKVMIITGGPDRVTLCTSLLRS